MKHLDDLIIDFTRNIDLAPFLNHAYLDTTSKGIDLIKETCKKNQKKDTKVDKKFYNYAWDTKTDPYLRSCIAVDWKSVLKAK